MRIEFERSGGFAGATVGTTLDTDELLSGEGREWETLVRDAELPSTSNLAGRPDYPDRFEYWIRISGQQGTAEARIAESQLTEPQRQLVHRLMDRLRHQP